MRATSLIPAAIVLAFVLLATQSVALARSRPPQVFPPVDAAQIDAAIDRGRDFIYSQIKGDNWEIVAAPTTRGAADDVKGGQWGQLTATCVYALLAAGEGAQNPKLAPAIKWLQSTTVHGTRALAMRMQVWWLLRENPQARSIAHSDANLLLLARRRPPSIAAGFWGDLPEKQSKQSSATPKSLEEEIHERPGAPKRTPLSEGGDLFDRSTSSRAIMALLSSSEYDEFPEDVWKQADTAWRRDQTPNGLWRASSGGSPVAMTAAGVTTLFITRDFLNREQLIELAGNLHDSNIELGMNWLKLHGDTLFRQKDAFEALFDIQQIGLVSGYKYVGDINWYERGAAALVAAQDPATGRFGVLGKPEDRLLNTAFAVLFLARGRQPVMMNKLRYQGVAATPSDGAPAPDTIPTDTDSPAPAAPLANWNQRPHDMLNLAQWVSAQLESDVNWQFMDVDAPVSEFHDAPIVLIDGNQQLVFTDAQKQKLRQFVEEGGLILGNANAGKDDFARSFKALGSALFPAYEFRPLPAGHAIYTDQQFPAAKFKDHPDLQGLSNGSRELMLLEAQDDPSRAWNFQMTSRHLDDFQLGADIFLYACDKQNLDRRPDPSVVTPDPKTHPTRSLTVARLKYDGNWDPEPGGWRRLAAIMHNQDNLELTTQTVELGKGQLAGKTIPVAHLTGTDQIRLTQDQAAELRNYVKGGGLLVIDAAGGMGNVAAGGFATSLETQLPTVFGADQAGQLREILPVADPFYTAAPPLKSASYRQYARKTVGKETHPRLRAMHIDGRLAVVFSPEDLSTGLVGMPVDGIDGYDPPTATLIMRKLVLSAAR